MSGSVEVVLFYGPPFIGKTLHYVNHYSKTHTRVSPSEIFQQDKCANLRQVVLKVIGLLSKGENVVIDDENWYTATRQSYASLIKKKVPNCQLTIVQFIPDITSGYEQCLWAREWALVQQSLLERNDYNSCFFTESDEKLDCWFARKRSDLNPPEQPTTSEGFSIVTVKPQLICGTSFKLTLPALVIQWQSILTDDKNKDVSYNSKVPQVLNKWSEKNPPGRIIIIAPKTKNDKDIIEEKTKTLLLNLSSQLITPLFFMLVDEKYQYDEYSRLPQPGVLAFIQKLHTLNLFHKATMYIYSTDDHYRAANSVGIRTIKATKLFNHPHLIDSVYCGETAPALPFLKDILQVNSSMSFEESILQGETVSEAQIPFLSRALESSLPLAWKYCHGKVTGVCFKDRLTLERYQNQYTLSARPSHPPRKMKSKSRRTKNIPSTIPHQSTNKRSLLTDKSPPDVKTMIGSIDLRQVAETNGRYLGGFQCRNNVFNTNIEVLERRIKITCKCSGSSSQPYDVEVLLSDSSGLIQSRCSCPDVAGKSGRCKHVIGLLLYYKDHEITSTSEVKPSDSSSSKTSRCGESKTNPISRSNKRGVQTLYCMSQEELLETAKEILKRNEEDKQSTEEELLRQKSDNRVGKVLADQQKTRSTGDENQKDVLEEILFSAINPSEKSPKKICRESLPSFAEETPTDKMPTCSSHERTDTVASIIIQDSLVPETVSIIPETLPSVSTSSTHSSCEEAGPSERGRLDNTNDSFEAFLDEII